MLEHEDLWSCTPADTALAASGVQVWAARLDVGPEKMTHFRSTLSKEELERASRFAFERDRTRFAAGRGLLRTILASCLGTDPSTLQFGYSTKGKPSLGGEFARSGLQFNLAHSGGLAVFAVSRRGGIGVDVEEMRAIPDLTGLAERFFSAREGAAIKSLAGEEQVGAFFRIWTRKEAWLKATGEGISELLTSIEVLEPPKSEQASCGTPGTPGDKRPWLCDLEPAHGFLGALAVMPQ